MWLLLQFSEVVNLCPENLLNNEMISIIWYFLMLSFLIFCLFFFPNLLVHYILNKVLFCFFFPAGRENI